MSSLLALIHVPSREQQTQGTVSGTEWRPDAMQGLSVVDVSTITSHPVEDRTTVTDHSVRQPTVVSFRAIVSPQKVGQEVSLKGTATQDGVVLSGDPVGYGRTGSEYVQDMWEWIRQAKDFRWTIRIQYDRSPVFGDFLVASCNRSFPAGRKDVHIQITLTQVTYARTVWDTVPGSIVSLANTPAPTPLEETTGLAQQKSLGKRSARPVKAATERSGADTETGNLALDFQIADAIRERNGVEPRYQPTPAPAVFRTSQPLATPFTPKF